MKLLIDENDLIIDNFCGGGGASEGIEEALQRAVDFAINHDDEAIRMHEVNHPRTVHLRNNVWRVDPLDVTEGRPVGFIWFSPDCKHFSKAKGGKPREKSIRDLAWVVVHWVKRLQQAARRAGDPNWRKIIKVIAIENVEEFRTWGPLCEQGYPIKERAGETFKQWCDELRKCGGKIEWKELRACDYGAPTIRKRFFMVIRFDGEPIRWPEPTHGKPGSPDVLSGKLLPWRSAAEIIDWSIPCPSIFDRKKPLAEKTLRRIAHGIMKFVVNNPKPFIVPLTHHQDGARGTPLDQPMPTVTGANRGEHAIVVPHVTKFRNGAVGHDVGEPLHTVTANSFVKRPGGSAPLGVVEAALLPFVTYAQQGGNNRSVDDPHHTICANSKDQNCVAAAHLVHIGNGEREGQAPRAMDVEKPLGTVVGSPKHHAVMAFMQKFAQNGQGYDPDEPLHTVMAGAPRHAVVCAHVEQANGGPNNANLAGRAADEPLSTATASGSQQRVVQTTLEPAATAKAARVAAFLVQYYGNSEDGQALDSPMGTIPTHDRFGLVTVTIDGEEYVIVDIGMRMLTPRELFNAQGFPPHYIIDHDAYGKPITKTAQVAKCGNSVPPPMSKAIASANLYAPGEPAREAQAA